MKTKLIAAALAAVLCGILPAPGWTQQLVLQDDFTGAAEAMNWKPFNGACLTAGNGSKNIPACVGLAYFGGEQLVGGNSGTLPDPVGSGALRFTNGYPGGYNQSGAIVSNFTFNTNAGLEVTFKTVTYRGDSGGGGGDGADGISFYLMNSVQQPGIGAFGGSLGYTCSNTNPPYDGLVGGYLGLGIDEFGNFLNPGDNTATGPGYQWNRIGLRGAGSISWAGLHAAYPTLYPSSLSSAQQQAAVQMTCSTGKLWDFSSNPNGSSTTQPAGGLLDYPAIANGYQVLNSLQIANESAVKRSDGTPITYDLKITPQGPACATSACLSLSYSLNNGASYQSVLTNQDISSNGTIPPSFRFGFAGSTGGDTNIHEILCFKATPANQSASSAGLNQQQTSKVQTGSQVYFAFYNPLTWAGSLTSQNLGLDVNGNVAISSVANWDASCVLTGVPNGQTCASTGAGPMAAQAPAQRTILSWSGSAGVPFEWAGGITAAERSALDVGDAGPINTNRLNYLRGDRTNEINAAGAGLYRARVSVLGDIINSSPAWVGPPQGPYAAVWSDKIITSGASLSENSGQTYTAFKTGTAQTRTNVVYTGANDGLLHGFRTGAYNSSGVFNTGAVNDGRELLAYMPSAVINGLNNIRGNAIPGNAVAGVDPTLDFSDSHYGHNFFVDAPPGTGDLFYNGAWHTWLVGGLGAGGAAIYALNVTDPTQFSEANAATLVVGEWTSTAGSSPLTCVNSATCYTNLGKTYGVPQIRRFHNGSWGAVFGNGFGSSTGDAGVYVMLVNPASGATTFYYLSTGKTPGNGIAYATAADLDGDHIVDYIYAGDLKGNVWRFDVTSNTPATWASTAPTLLFTTNSGQPITSQLAVASTPSFQGLPRVMVDFGTGQINQFTNTSANSYASGSQSLYGVWDWNMSTWNAKGSTQYSSLSAGATGLGGNPVTPANLQVQTLTDQGGGTRSSSSNVVCWQGSTQTCANGTNSLFGWKIGLPGSSGGSPSYAEQVIYSPTLADGAFIVNTTIAASNTATSCTIGIASGWTIAVSPTTGGSFTSSFFSDASGNPLTKNNNVVSALALSGTGSVSIVSVSSGTTTPAPNYLITQTVSGTGVAQRINPPAGTKGGRLTWLELR